MRKLVKPDSPCPSVRPAIPNAVVRITGPSDGISSTGSLTRAVDLLTAGAWQQAHEIVQGDTSALAAWLHGIVHSLEGDLDNARYWYRKADRAYPGPDTVQEEIAAAREIVQRGGETTGD